MLFLKTYSYNASFYDNVIKGQWQRSHTERRKYRLNNILSLKNLNSFIYILFIVFNLILVNGIETISKIYKYTVFH